MQINRKNFIIISYYFFSIEYRNLLKNIQYKNGTNASGVNDNVSNNLNKNSTSSGYISFYGKKCFNTTRDSKESNEIKENVDFVIFKRKCECFVRENCRIENKALIKLKKNNLNAINKIETNKNSSSRINDLIMNKDELLKLYL